jgi:hypothetical protein
MQMVEHYLDLLGDSVAEGKAKPEAAGAVLRYVEPVLRMTVSMAFRNTSRRLGRPPEWLRRAADVRLVEICPSQAGGTRLNFIAPRFGEAAEEIYRQQEAFRVRPRQQHTGFDLFGDVIDDLRSGRGDSFRYDSALLARIHKLVTSAGQTGVERILLLGDRLPSHDPLSIDQEISRQAQRMRNSTPPDQRARVCGKLDMIRDSDSVFEILLEPDTIVRGVWMGQSMDALQAMWREKVLLEGLAVYKPSGGLLRIEADAVRPASKADELFQRIPAPLGGKGGRLDFRQEQSAQTGANALLGRWPGEETEEQLLLACRESD